MTALIICAAVLLDRLLGETPRWHPLVGFGRYASLVESLLNRRNFFNRAAGVLAVLLAVLPLVLASYFAARYLQNIHIYYYSLFSVLVLYLAIGGRSLCEHARSVQNSLDDNNMPESRKRVSYIVSRDCADMKSADVSKATIESVLENGSDAIFGAIFFFCVAGPAGVIAYRLLNTLDAMWGYKNQRFLKFGWAAARIDDLVNIVPARLTALSYACVGTFVQAIRCWWQQARHWDSPNAGPVMAAGAGALNLQLGGAASYHGEIHHRPQLGTGNTPTAADIGRACNLLQNSVMLWIFLLTIISLCTGCFYA